MRQARTVSSRLAALELRMQILQRGQSPHNPLLAEVCRFAFRFAEDLLKASARSPQHPKTYQLDYVPLLRSPNTIRPKTTRFEITLHTTFKISRSPDCCVFVARTIARKMPASSEFAFDCLMSNPSNAPEAIPVRCRRG